MAKKRVATLVLSIALLLAVTVGGTLAYLTDTDSDVNVMTLGNVQIEQIEQQWNDDQSALEPFDQFKPLYPYVGELGWENTKQDNGAYRRFTMANVQDKYVSVKNTGASDAYVRTFIALEMGDYSYDEFNMIGISTNAAKGAEFQFDGAWVWTDDFVAEIDGHNYNVMVAVHQNPVKPGETTIPSLLQVYLKNTATNETVEKLDGNDNGTYDILVFSEAVQTAGFENAETALDAAFGDITKTNHPWINGAFTYVSNLDELKAAFAQGGNIMLTDDIEIDKMTTIASGKEVYLNLNGHTITVDENTASNTMIWIQEGAKLTIDGNGTIDMGEVNTMAIFCPYGELVIENGTFIRDRFYADDVTDKTTGLFMGAKIVGSTVTINGGYFDPGYYDPNAANIEDLLAADSEVDFETDADEANRDKPGDTNAVRMAIKDNVSALLNHSGYGPFKVYGGTFVGANPAWGDEGCAMPTTPNYLRPWSYYQGTFLAGQEMHDDKIVVPDGYTITESTHADGRPVYTVSYSK